MSDLPNVFDGPNFKPLPEEVILTLGNDEAAAYVELANAAALMADADKAVTDAQAHVTHCIANVREAEKYIIDNYPQPTRMDETKRMIAYNNEQRARRAGL